MPIDNIDRGREKERRRDKERNREWEKVWRRREREYREEEREREKDNERARQIIQNCRVQMASALSEYKVPLLFYQFIIENIQIVIY